MVEQHGRRYHHEVYLYDTCLEPRRRRDVFGAVAATRRGKTCIPNRLRESTRVVLRSPRDVVVGIHESPEDDETRSTRDAILNGKRA